MHGFHLFERQFNFVSHKSNFTKFFLKRWPNHSWMLCWNKKKVSYVIAPSNSFLVIFTGYFGAGIGSFFLFLRSLVWVNFVLLTFIAIFVIAPQVKVLVSCTEFKTSCASVRRDIQNGNIKKSKQNNIPNLLQLQVLFTLSQFSVCLFQICLDFKSRYPITSLQISCSCPFGKTGDCAFLLL